MKLKTICFDIDNVICKTNFNHDYSKSKPIKNFEKPLTNSKKRVSVKKKRKIPSLTGRDFVFI